MLLMLTFLQLWWQGNHTMHAYSQTYTCENKNTTENESGKRNGFPPHWKTLFFLSRSPYLVLIYFIILNFNSLFYLIFIAHGLPSWMLNVCCFIEIHNDTEVPHKSIPVRRKQNRMPNAKHTVRPGVKWIVDSDHDKTLLKTTFYFFRIRICEGMFFRGFCWLQPLWDQNRK